MLTEVQRAEFERTGIVKLEGVFTEDEATRMREVVWRELARRHGIQRDDPSTWQPESPYKMETSKRSEVFAPMLGPALRGALDDLLGSGRWAQPKHMGQVLITMPHATAWRVPHHGWHTDVGYAYAGDELFGVKHWAFFDTVDFGGGGTLQLAGSHRLLARYVSGLPPKDREYKRVRDTFLKTHPWLRALGTDDDDPDRNRRFMDAEADIDGLPARVVELSGKPGDVFLTHLWVMHAKAPNAGTRPRMMRSKAFLRTDV